MDIVNIADLAGFLFLGFGLLDGYRKGLVKKAVQTLTQEEKARARL